MDAADIVEFQEKVDRVFGEWRVMSLPNSANIGEIYC